MAELVPVSFTKPREKLPRLSEPYDPTRHHERYWQEWEDEIIRTYYPAGGLAAVALRLPQHHTGKAAIYGRAGLLGVNKAGKQPREAHDYGPEMDARIRAAWPLLSGRKKGEVNGLADELGVPRWWLSKQARKLELQIVVWKKEPPWTAAEDALLATAPVHDLHAASRFFREHGFSRSQNAIAVRCKRREIRRRAARPTLSATAAAKIIGIDAKGVTARIFAGEIKAVKREDRRLPQQGGPSWDIARGELRRFVIDKLEQIDFRKVDKFALVDLLVNSAGDGGPPTSPAEDGEDGLLPGPVLRLELGGGPATEPGAAAIPPSVAPHAAAQPAPPPTQFAAVRNKGHDHVHRDGAEGEDSGRATPSAPRRRGRSSEPPRWSPEAKRAARDARRGRRRHG